MYSNKSSSVPINMPLVRRRRSLMRLSCSPVTTVDAQGTAYLCFPEDHSWFQGNISTDDESNYSLYGERVALTQEEKAAAAAYFSKKISKLSMLTESDEENNNCDGDDESFNNGDINMKSKHAKVPSDCYRVTLIDHFSGQKHNLPKIFVMPTENSSSVVVSPGQLFTSQHGEVNFEVEKVYRGQKADIMIHKVLGSANHAGTNSLLYAGPINILFDEMIESGRTWSL